MSTKIRVAIVDDHQAIIDGYKSRLSRAPEVEIVLTALYGEELDRLLERYPIDVLIVDVELPISAENRNPYPLIPRILSFSQLYPEMKILVISMHNQATLIRNLMDAGARGYILKDDHVAIRELDAIIRSIAGGGVFHSQEAYALIRARGQPADNILLTPREQEVLALCAAYPDATTFELAGKLGIADATYRNLLSKAYQRLGVHSKTAAINRARQLGLITPPNPSLEV